MGSNFKLKYNVDLVFCIDATQSMDGILDKVKLNALHFYDDLTAAMQEEGKHVDSLRARIVAFRDYRADREPMMVTNFFELPAEAQDFADCIMSIEPNGGGDDPEDSLEALAYAIRSDWRRSQGALNREVIVLWTDAGPHPIGYGSVSPNYPKGMPKNLEELSAWWGAPGAPGYMNERGKRILLYAPEDPTWEKIANSWNNSLFFASEAGQGLGEHEYNWIIHTIAQSV